MDIEGESGGNCSRDYIQVLDGNDEFSPVIGTFCGNTLPAQMTAIGASMVVRFVSDSTVQQRGFRAIYTKSTSGNVNCELNVITVLERYFILFDCSLQQSNMCVFKREFCISFPVNALLVFFF